MKLQEKTSLILVVLLIFSLVVISIVVSAISLSSYAALEKVYVARDVSQAVNKIGEESETLFSIVSDWGPWDDTCDFVSGTYPDYVEKNLVPETYENLRLDVVLIVKKDGDVAYAGAYDSQNRTLVAVPDALLARVRPGSPLMNISDPVSGTRGILVTPQGPMIIASRPIVHTDHTGEPLGVVVMGRYLDEAEVTRLSRLTNPSLRFLVTGDPDLPAGIVEELARDSSRTSSIVRVLSEDQVGGYALIRDIYGNDALVLQIADIRDIFRQGVTTTLQYVLIVLATGLLLGVCVLFILDRLVLSRIMDLSRQVSRIGRTTDVSPRISLDGNDEFSGLAAEINRMLETIEQTQLGLAASETRFRDLAELLPQIIFEIDLDGRLLYVNRAGADIFGVTDEKIRAGSSVRDYVIPEDHERMQQGLAAILAGARSSGQIFSLRRADNNLMRAIIYTAPVFRAGGPRGFRGIVVDITDRILLEEALTESQEYLQTLLMSVRVGIVVIDAENHTIADANPAALEMIGTTRDDLINRSCHGLICPSEPGACPVTDLHNMVDNSERDLLTRDGKHVSIIKYVVPVMLHDRACLLETFIDNTPRKQIEQELRESRERLSGILQASPVGVFETRPDGTLTYVNERWEEMTGLSLAAMWGKRWTETLHPLDRVRVERDIGEMVKIHHIVKAEARFIRPDGTIIWVFGQAVPLYDPDGSVRGFTGTITDITDRKRDEEAIQLANKKLNLMNNITRHDILNTITGLFGLVDMAVASDQKQDAVQLLVQIKELARVIQRQITFTREYQDVGVNAPRWQNIRQIALRAIENFTKSGLKFIVEIENTEVYADPLLEKVFYNLIDNAIRYGEHVRTIRFYYEISDQGLSLICEDDGVGIPDRAKEQIFERGVGKNTGMGLFLTREILMITDIRIRETGILGNGARFEILIPNGMWRFAREEEKREA